jgi:hypothetical protein
VLVYIHSVWGWGDTNSSFFLGLLFSLTPGLFLCKLAALLLGGIGGVHYTVDVPGAGISDGLGDFLRSRLA